VNKALDMIKRKFPVKRFPGIDYDRCLPDMPVLPADVMQVTTTCSESKIQYFYAHCTHNDRFYSNKLITVYCLFRVCSVHFFKLLDTRFGIMCGAA